MAKYAIVNPLTFKHTKDDIIEEWGTSKITKSSHRVHPFLASASAHFLASWYTCFTLVRRILLSNDLQSADRENLKKKKSQQRRIWCVRAISRFNQIHNNFFVKFDFKILYTKLSGQEEPIPKGPEFCYNACCKANRSRESLYPVTHTIPYKPSSSSLSQGFQGKLHPYLTCTIQRVVYST